MELYLLMMEAVFCSINPTPCNKLLLLLLLLYIIIMHDDDDNKKSSKTKISFSS